MTVNDDKGIMSLLAVSYPPSSVPCTIKHFLFMLQGAQDKKQGMELVEMKQIIGSQKIKTIACTSVNFLGFCSIIFFVSFLFRLNKVNF
jgi:hypothetical protein